MIIKELSRAVLCAVTIGSAVFAQTAALPADSNATLDKTTRFAESLYETYADGTSGAMSIEVNTIRAGKLKELAGKPFSSILSVPLYRIESEQVGTKFNNVQPFVPDDPQYGLHDMNYTADRFDNYGLPMADGTYRLLNVVTTLNGEVHSHQALEFCWKAENHCAVVDPVIVFLQSKAESRQALAAQHWGRQSTMIPVPGGLPPLGSNALNNASPAAADSGVCQLSGHRGYVGWTWTWAAYTQKYKDVFGLTLVTKYLGEQSTGIGCDSSCKPRPSSFSAASSASGTLGYSTACDNTGSAIGTTGGDGTAIAETKCTHKFAGGASATVTIKGSGYGISASWNTNGGVDSNGGIYKDSCARF